MEGAWGSASTQCTAHHTRVVHAQSVKAHSCNALAMQQRPSTGLTGQRVDSRVVWVAIKPYYMYITTWNKEWNADDNCTWHICTRWLICGDSFW